MRMKFICLAGIILALLAGRPAMAWENSNNSLSPYPSGCLTYFMLHGLFYPTPQQTLVDGPIIINSTTEEGAVTANLTILRTGCAEANRSVIWVAISIVDDEDGNDEFGVMPTFSARVGDDVFPMRLTEEPNAWVANDAGDALPEGTMRYYVVDIPTPLSSGFDNGPFIIPTMYNGAWTLLIDNADSDSDYTAPIPAYDNSMQQAYMPFNGRLSGIWVVAGAADQGFVISFSELPGNVSQGLIFFSWYTFDENGNNVWLVGNALYESGDGTITFELQLVTGGVFLGSETAARTTVGSVTITAKNCNLLELMYDLSDIGLGSGTVSVVRLENIETAGYACMDPETRGAVAPLP